MHAPTHTHMPVIYRSAASWGRGLVPLWVPGLEVEVKQNNHGYFKQGAPWSWTNDAKDQVGANEGNGANLTESRHLPMARNTSQPVLTAANWKLCALHPGFLADFPSCPTSRVFPTLAPRSSSVQYIISLGNPSNAFIGNSKAGANNVCQYMY